MIRVKVCGMINPLNLKEIATGAPDFIGIIFYPASPRYVGEEAEPGLVKNFPQGIKRVGVFLDENISEIVKISQRAGLDLIQLHGNESPAYCSRLRSSGLSVIKAFNIENKFNFESLIGYLPVCDFFLFDTKSNKPGGSGRKFNWEKLDEYSFDKPFFLSGGVGPEDTGLIKSIRNQRLYAVDINSRFETVPGIKDAELVRKFIEEIKIDRQ
jgi:phosphoribosylanthranilate isomerase